MTVHRMGRSFRKASFMEEKQCPYRIRWAKVQDWNPAIDMVWKTFLKFEGEDYSKEGIKNFDFFIHGEELFQLFLRDDYKAMVAVDGDRVIGFASVRDGNFLSLLFVDEEYHRQGVGRALLDHMSTYLKEQKGEAIMYLTASPYAIDFYKKLGFFTRGQEQIVSGIRITHMEKIL